MEYGICCKKYLKIGKMRAKGGLELLVNSIRV